MLNAFTLESKASLLGLNDAVCRKMGVIPLPGGVNEVNTVAMPAQPDRLAPSHLIGCSHVYLSTVRSIINSVFMRPEMAASLLLGHCA